MYDRQLHKQARTRLPCLWPSKQYIKLFGSTHFYALSLMEKHNSIVQAEAAAACVGLILLALVIVTIVVLVLIFWMRHKMKERSEFSIHISRNFSDSLRDKETPISDFDRNSFKNQTFDGLESKIVVATPDSPFHEHTSSFIQTTNKTTSSGFTNPHPERDGSTGSETSLPNMEMNEKPSIGSGKESLKEDETVKGEIQMLVQTEPTKPPVAAPRASSQSSTPRRSPPQLPTKPKPYTGPSTSMNKPPVPDKPAISAKPPKMRQPMLPPINKPMMEGHDMDCEGEVKAAPDIKPKPKILPRKI